MTRSPGPQQLGEVELCWCGGTPARCQPPLERLDLELLALEFEHERRRLLSPLTARIGRWERDDRGRCGRQYCADVARFFRRRGASRTQRTTGREPFAFWQQRVVARPRRKRAFGRAHDDDEIEVGAHRVDQPADENTVAEPPDASGGTLELVGQQPDELGEIGIWPDAIQLGQLVEEVEHRPSRARVGLRPRRGGRLVTDVPHEQTLGPATERAPSTTFTGIGRRGETIDE